MSLSYSKQNVFGRQLFRAMLDGRGQENAPPFAENTDVTGPQLQFVSAVRPNSALCAGQKPRAKCENPCKDKNTQLDSAHIKVKPMILPM